ncbi:MAG: DUF507 family protein [Deltaproteobacteria bacterium]|nr:DUF507 family protein [Deltaproteobacteria bacterium]
MRLKKEQIQTLADRVLAEIRKEPSIRLKAAEDKIKHKIIELISNDFLKEDKLDEEVKKMMEQYKAQIAAGNMDAQKVFQMIKKQLVKERNLVL